MSDKFIASYSHYGAVCGDGFYRALCGSSLFAQSDDRLTDSIAKVNCEDCYKKYYKYKINEVGDSVG